MIKDQPVAAAKMGYSFSNDTRTMLQRAGWNEHRRLETMGYVSYLQSKGVPVHAKALEFWQRFGGLRVVHPHSRVPGAEDYFELDPVHATDRTNIRNLKRFSERVGAPLCIIGEARRGYMVLLMDPTGSVYAGLDRLLESVGPSGEAAIEALCSGIKLEQLP